MPALKKRNYTPILKLLVIVFGGAVAAAALALFIVPANLMAGGVTGIGIILNRLFGIPIGVVILVLNLPLFIWGYKDMGRDFFIGSLVGTLSSSLLLDFFGVILPEMPALVADRLLATATGGALYGVGLGLTIAAGGSGGGTDILGIVLNHRLQTISIGRLILILNILIVIGGLALIGETTAALYTVIYMYISSAAVDAVVYGANMSMVSYIITQKPSEVSDAIIAQLGRGVTMLEGVGGYTGNPQGVLLCAIAKRQLPRLKKVIKTADCDAFVIVSEAKEVMGKGFHGAV